MINYQNGKIYKIINENNDIVYIGSTTQPLSHRYTKHKHKAPNHKIILIENYACNSKEELCMKEQEFIEQYDNLLNKIKAYCSEEEQKEEFYQYQKKYREENKEQKKQIDKKYRENNIEKIKEYTKEWSKNNKEKIKEYKNEYYQNNKEKINCEFCNCLISRYNIKNHQKTMKCKKFQLIED